LGCVPVVVGLCCPLPATQGQQHPTITPLQPQYNSNNSATQQHQRGNKQPRSGAVSASGMQQGGNTYIADNYKSGICKMRQAAAGQQGGSKQVGNPRRHWMEAGKKATFCTLPAIKFDNEKLYESL